MVASQIAMDRRGCQKLYIRAEVVSPSFAEIAKSTWNAWLKGDTITYNVHMNPKSVTFVEM